MERWMDRMMHLFLTVPSLASLPTIDCLSIPRPSISSNPSQSMSSTISVTNLSWDTTDDSLHAAFVGFGKIIKAVVLKVPIHRLFPRLWLGHLRV
ncbi:hypothetical protein EDD21DRAFT_389362 [Dissophora ornata]|nr:hypothetical protein EDD21DRAFT_389362 [Dissophora ornata]